MLIFSSHAGTSHLNCMCPLWIWIGSHKLELKMKMLVLFVLVVLWTTFEVRTNLKTLITLKLYVVI